jgi:hypothetical protein
LVRWQSADSQIGRLTVRRSPIESLTIGHLTVDRLTIRESDEPKQTL